MNSFKQKEFLSCCNLLSSCLKTLKNHEFCNLKKIFHGTKFVIAVVVQLQLVARISSTYVNVIQELFLSNFNLWRLRSLQILKGNLKTPSSSSSVPSGKHISYQQISDLLIAFMPPVSSPSQITICRSAKFPFKNSEFWWQGCAISPQIVPLVKFF